MRVGHACLHGVFALLPICTLASAAALGVGTAITARAEAYAGSSDSYEVHLAGLLISALLQPATASAQIVHLCHRLCHTLWRIVMLLLQAVAQYHCDTCLDRCCEAKLARLRPVLSSALQTLCRDNQADVQEGLVNFFPALLAQLPCSSRACFFQTLTQSLSLECATWRCRIGLATQLGALARLEVQSEFWCCGFLKRKCAQSHSHHACAWFVVCACRKADQA